MIALFRFLGRVISSALLTAVVLVLALALLFGWRQMTVSQLDDSVRVHNKLDYLEQIETLPASEIAPPNIIFILYDDLGYADLGFNRPQAAPGPILTPNLDQLAHDGVVLSDFHSPAPVCTPSRAGYLTGRLAPRAGLPNVVFPTGSLKAALFSNVLSPESNQRLPAEEITMADVLAAHGYRTGMVGKWHLGDRSPSLPNDMGFQSYFGPLYSNDMEPFAFYRNGDIAVEAPVDQRTMTEVYTREALQFIEEDSQAPFFLYFAHSFPHDPLSVRDSLAGGSAAGLFGDVMEEIDAGIGDLVTALREQGELDNTLIIVSSDNGPWYLGDAGNQRGRKGNTFEGGMRVPFLAHWPARIEGGRTEAAMAMGVDLMPTLLDLLELPAPEDRILDGRSLRSVLLEGGDSPHEYLHYYDGETLFATRSQRFKYRGPAGVLYATDQMPVGGAVPQKGWLFDLEVDSREAYDTSLRHPDELNALRQEFLRKQDEMRDNLRGWR